MLKHLVLGEKKNQLQHAWREKGSPQNKSGSSVVISRVIIKQSNLLVNLASCLLIATTVAIVLDSHWKVAKLRGLGKYEANCHGKERHVVSSYLASLSFPSCK